MRAEYESRVWEQNKVCERTLNLWRGRTRSSEYYAHLILLMEKIFPNVVNLSESKLLLPLLRLNTNSFIVSKFWYYHSILSILLISDDVVIECRRNMGKWKCLWCSKVLEGESFMDLVEASMREERGQHVHGWENITLIEEKPVAVLENKLLSV